MKVNFSMNNADNKYNATVIATEKGIDAATRNLKVRALVNSQSTELISGAYANVTLRLNENKNALLIPSNALIPQEENKTVIVAKNGKAHFVVVKTGIRQPTNIEITNGIQIGDTIITSGLQFLKENSPLTYSTVTNKL